MSRWEPSFLYLAVLFLLPSKQVKHWEERACMEAEASAAGGQGGAQQEAEEWDRALQEAERLRERLAAEEAAAEGCRAIGGSKNGSRCCGGRGAGGCGRVSAA